MEEKWAKQQKEALKKISGKSQNDEKTLEPEELLKKAQQFFEAEDYDSAMEAYNYGINNLCPNYAPIWNNRAAVQLKLGNYYEAINDASKALQLLDPPVQSNAVMRAKAFIRRGKIFRRKTKLH